MGVYFGEAADVIGRTDTASQPPSLVGGQPSFAFPKNQCWFVGSCVWGEHPMCGSLVCLLPVASFPGEE